MQVLYNLLLYMVFQLSELQYPVISQRVVFHLRFSKLLWDDAPEYQERSAQELPNCGSAASMLRKGIFTALTVLRKE